MIIPVGYAQVNYKFTGAAVPRGAQVAIGVKLDADSPAPLEVAETALAAWDLGPQGRQVNTCILTNIHVKFGPNEDGIAGDFAASLAGAQNETALTPQTAVLVSKQTAAGGRHNRGRMFVPGIPEAEVDGSGVMGSAQVTAWETALAAMLARFATDEYPMVILHAADGITPILVSELHVVPLVATQRRRVRRVGGRRRTGV